METDQKYTRITAEDSNDYYCPLEIARDRVHLRGENLDDCVEAEVVGRYIGHLNIDSRH